MASARGDHGASAVEYGLLATAIASIIVLAVFALGGFTSSLFSDTCTTIQTETPSTSDECT